MNLILDTHTWVWWNARPEALSRKAMRAIRESQAPDEILLPAIAIWELGQWLAQGRLILSCDVHGWVERALNMPGLRVAELTPAISLESAALPGAFEGDYCDAMIAATARVHNGAIITCDPLFQNYSHVKTIW